MTHERKGAAREAVRAAPERAPNRRPAAIAYGITLVLVLSGVGLIGVAVASQLEIPQAPAVPIAVASTPPTPVASTAPDAGEPGATTATTPSHDGFRAMTGTAPAAPSRREPAAEEPAPLTLPRSRPVALDIPSIDVDSVVRRVGLTDEGKLETPSGAHYNDAAWYRHSPTPGSLGPSILLGHVDSATDGPSVFFRLGELRAGDRVKVSRADGSVAVFKVDDVRRFPKKDFPTELVYGDIDHAGLRLLTCGGPFNEVSGHYRDNVVVFASLVDE